MKGYEAKPGKIRDHKGQRYVCVAIEPYVRRDGALSCVAVWHSHCADCGDAFEFRSTKRFVKFQPNRRCSAHRKAIPGKHRNPS